MMNKPHSLSSFVVGQRVHAFSHPFEGNVIKVEGFLVTVKNDDNEELTLNDSAWEHGPTPTY